MSVARHMVNDERMECLVQNHLSWLRFLGFGLGAAARTALPEFHALG